jgi:hypothetical protein
MKLEKDNMAYFSTAVEEELEMDELDYEYDLFRRTVANIEAAVEAGLKDPEEGEALVAQAHQEFMIRSGQELGYDYEEEEEDAEYSAYDGLAEFEVGNDFGAAVLELAAEEYEDPADAIVDIAEHTGLAVEDVVGLLEGRYVPTEELAHAIAQVFTITSSDDDFYEGFMSIADEVRGDEEEYDEDEVDEEDDEANYRIAQLEDQVAEFQAQTEVTNQLQQLERYAAQGVQEGWLPPVAREAVMSNFETDSDRLAAFSQVCDSNRVDVATELYATQKILETFEKCGPFARFSSVLEGEKLPQPGSKEAEQEQQALLNHKLRKQRR